MSSQSPKQDTALDSAIADLAARLRPTQIETGQPIRTGRILASPVVADRDSPAADVSAMDGYALRLRDLDRVDSIPVSGESAPGAPPPEPTADAAIRVFTGAIVPSEFDVVVKREDTEESEGSVKLLPSARGIELGTHIRRAGENARAGSLILSPGTEITGATRAAMANFGCREVDVFAKVRVTLITTGNEVGDFLDESPKPWQLRNSNRASVSAILERQPWIELVHVGHCMDDRDMLKQVLQRQLAVSDAILLTGGVSMGNYDYVPDVIREVGGEVVFHGIPIRPGKPVLGAATRDGKLLMGLPGNPVSATVGSQRIALPLLRKAAGFGPWMPFTASVRVQMPDEKKIPLIWLRLVKLVDHGVVELVDSLGSGDLVSLGHSSGFIQLPPGESGEGPWPYFPWT